MLSLNATYDDNVTAATGTAVQQFAAIVKEKLCRYVCKNQSIQPTYSVTYSLGNIETIGTTTFVELIATGNIVYVPKSGCQCSARTEPFTERTTLMFSNTSATSAPTVSLTQGVSDGFLADMNCTSSNQYEIVTNVTVQAVYA